MTVNRPRGTRLLSLSLGATLLLPMLTVAPALATPGTEKQESSSTLDLSSSAAKAIVSGLKKGPDLSAEERIALADQALTALGDDFLDAQMGQGQRRIDESGDPTAPTLQELADLAQVADGQSTDAKKLNIAAPASLDELRTWRPPGVIGIDVSRFQGTVDWPAAYKNGARFGYIKATQSWPSSVYKDPEFETNYSAAKAAGVIRGSYHFAMPAHSSGAAQAKEFLANGGSWSADGSTLPPLLDVEWNPYSEQAYPEGKGDVCYGMTADQMVNWIKSYGNTIKSATGRLPMIYTAQSWWDECTSDSTAFTSWPLHVSLFPTADVAKNPRELPEGWSTFNVWQYSSNSNLLGDSLDVDANVWNGDITSLRDFAKNTRTTPYKLTTSYFGNADVWPTRLEPYRVFGNTRFDTPVSISKESFPSTAPAVVIASGERFPDALSGSPLATLNNAPLLLTKKDGLPSSVVAELKRLKPKKIIVLGGPSAITNATVNKLKAYGTVSRVYGASLYDTSAQISAKWSTSSEVFLATGQRFEDAMSLAAVAAGRKAPMLLTQKTSVPASTVKELKRLKPKNLYLAGGPNAISTKAESQLRKALPQTNVVRYQGTSLYDTSALIAQKFWPQGSQRQYFATASTFQDGLTGAVAAGYNGAPLLLSKKDCVPASVGNALTSLQGWTNVLLGGPLALDSTVAYRADGNLNVCK